MTYDRTISLSRVIFRYKLVFFFSSLAFVPDALPPTKTLFLLTWRNTLTPH